MGPEIPLKIGNCKNDIAASLKIILQNYHLSYIVSRKIRVHFETSEYTIRAGDH